MEINQLIFTLLCTFGYTGEENTMMLRAVSWLFALAIPAFICVALSIFIYTRLLVSRCGELRLLGRATLAGTHVWHFLALLHNSNRN